MSSSDGVGRADAAPPGDLNGSRRKFASGTFYDQESFSFTHTMNLSLLHERRMPEPYLTRARKVRRKKNFQKASSRELSDRNWAMK